MSSKVVVRRRASGPSGQSVDCWYLIEKDDGSFWVEHTWWHPRDDEAPDVGSVITSARQMFAKSDDPELVGLLRSAIANAKK